jgi:hypothetical protein
MGVFSEATNNIGDNIRHYSKSAWQLLLQEAEAEMAGLTRFNTLGEKKVSALRQNLSYIKESNAIVHGYTPQDFEDRVDFTYYEKDVNNPDEPAPKPRLVNPHNDGFRKEVMKEGGFKPQTAFLADQKTLTVSSNGQLTNYIYNEHLKDDTKMDAYAESTTGIGMTDYSSVRAMGNSLVGKTNKWMRGIKDDYISRRFKTIISRFHTSNSSADIEELKAGVSNTAMSQFGLSHGRNLLKTDDEGSVISDPLNPYDNPYCRVWTYHHQNNKFVQDTIRPFQYVSAEELDKTYHWDSMRTSAHDGFSSGNARLRKYGVMYDNDGKTTGLVNITPKSDGNGIKGNGGVDITHCMFSIENLAWKGMFNDYGDEMEEYGLSIDQKGPFGGRIMWFPPYNLKFSENSNASWDANEFIGRGEPIFTYSNTRRSGNLSFTMLIDHPSILDYWERRNMGQGGRGDGGVDDTQSKEQQMLRFFAGCDILKAGLPPQEPIVEPQKKVDIEPVTENEDKVFQFLVFYPNNYSGKDDKIGGTVNPIHYLMGGIGAQKERLANGTVQDFPVDFSKVYISPNGYICGGYEVRGPQGSRKLGVGVSTIDSATTNNDISTVSILGSTETKLLAKSIYPSKEKVPYNNTWGDSKKDKEAKSNWHKQRYYYRADTDTLGQLLVGEDNDGAVSYIDKNSYQFNGKNVGDAVKYWGLKDRTFSFAEMFTVLESENAQYSEKFCRPDDLADLKAIMKTAKGHITEVRCIGRASSQANNESEVVNTERNNTLARNRAETIRKWLETRLKVEGNNVFHTSLTFNFDKTRDEPVQDDSNDRLAKLNRFCLVEIHYKLDDVEDVSKGNIRIDESGNPENYSTTVINSNEGVNQAENDKKLQEEQEARRSTKSVGTTRNKYKRYDDEYKFFDKIHENAPFAEKLLSDRIKIFNPAFHSMSPEGFSARLNFLHQCTRQGPTLSASQSMGENATNLSFGRPPVCILRVGDFYYTKIIINSINIDYDPLQWDLNDEGIGVMPMMANINIGFDFIGGSDLSGPISRLQNALSFNYYANGSVYDNRAEQVEYKDGTMGKVKSFKPYFGQLTGYN